MGAAALEMHFPAHGTGAKRSRSTEQLLWSLFVIFGQCHDQCVKKVKGEEQNQKNPFHNDNSFCLMFVSYHMGWE